MTAGKIGRALVLAAGLAGLAPAAWAETLTDALIAAYRNSNLLEQNRAVLRAADEGVAQAVASLGPVLSFIISGKVQDPATASTYYNNLYGTIALQGTLTLYDGGKGKLSIAAAKESVLATREALVGVEQQVLLAAATAYLKVLNAEEVVVLNQGNVRVLEQELKAAQDRFDVGEITKTDVAQAQAALAQAQAQLVSAQGELLVAREAYKAATGAYPNRLAPAPRAPRIARSLEEAKAIATRTHPTVLQAQHQVAAADLGVQRAKTAAGPSISATAQVDLDNESNSAASLSITANQPIYTSGQISAAYRSALATRDQARAALMQAAITVQQSVGNAWSQLQAAEASLAAIDKQIAAAQVAYDGVREEAKLGARTTLDVLNAEQALLNARASRIAAETNLKVQIYTLLATMGLLTADHLKLGIPTYDPEAYYNAVKNAPPTSVQGKRLDKVLATIGKK